MGSNETVTSSKSEKSSSPTQEHTNIHAYPDWASIQGYYGAGVPLPPPYFNSAVTAGHPPHPYMWAQHQALMPPYGAPYAAIYSHGGIYAHPSVSFGSHGHGIPSSPAVGEAVVATPLSIATPAKSPRNRDQGSVKKLKGFDGVAVSAGNENAGSAGGSQSEENGTEGSSDRSDGNTATGEGQMLKKRNCEGTQPTGKLVGTVSSSSMTTALEVSSSLGVKTKTTAVGVHPALSAAAPARDGLPSEIWIRDERELKRERRKQSNRESARRSRLRKQVECEELAKKVESLNAENLMLRSQINQLMETSNELRQENVVLMEKLKNAQLGQTEEMVSNNIKEQGTSSVSTENFLSRLNNSSSNTINQQLETGVCENSNAGAKLHQLLESSTRADTVAAG